MIAQNSINCTYFWPIFGKILGAATIQERPLFAWVRYSPGQDHPHTLQYFPEPILMLQLDLAYLKYKFFIHIEPEGQIDVKFQIVM